MVWSLNDLILLPVGNRKLENNYVSMVLWYAIMTSVVVMNIRVIFSQVFSYLECLKAYLTPTFAVLSLLEWVIAASENGRNITDQFRQISKSW